MKTLYSLFILLLAFPVLAFAQAGMVDQNFGISGYAAPQGFASIDEYGWAVAVRPNGKILVMGNKGSTTQMSAQFMPNGSPDNGYGTVNGFADGASVVGSFGVRDGQLLSNGRFIVVGNTLGQGGSQVAVRRLADGTTDTTYGTNGQTVVAVTAGSDKVFRCTVGANGDLFLTGESPMNDGMDLVVTKLDSTGTVDNSFGSSGIAVLGHSGDDQGQCVLEDDMGRIVVGGMVRDTTVRSLAVVRFLSDGSLDNSFGSAGLQKVVQTLSGEFSAIAIDDMGNYVLAGRGNYSGGIDSVYVARMDASGTLDPSFGSGGMQALEVGDNGVNVTDMVILPDGKILISGHVSRLSTQREFFAMRLDAGGTLDNTFGTGGVTMTGYSTTIDVCRGMAIDQQGGIILAGHNDLLSYEGIFLTRLFNDGTVDVGFQQASSSIDFYPSPTSNGDVSVNSPAGSTIELVAVFDAQGRMVSTRSEATANGLLLGLPDQPGMYLIELLVDGAAIMGKVLRN